MRPSESYPTLREQVRDVLLEAGFKARQDTLPTYLSKGTFDLTSGAGVLVRVAWWESSDEERAALLGLFAAALRKAGFAVQDRDGGIFVAGAGFEPATSGL